MDIRHFAGASLLALGAAQPALAQTTTAPSTTAPVAAPTETATDDIIVTATKRPQTLQDVPVSVAVTNQQTIERAQIRDLIDLQSVVPSLKVIQANTVGATNFYIRGFGNGAGNVGIEGSVGVFIDGVYRSRSAASLNDLPEVERIEVLRGPQSTLFGKNVSAGAINIVTRRPSFKRSGSAELTLGNFGLVASKATITGPLAENVAIRLSGNVNGRDGTLHDVVTGKRINDRNRYSLRGDLLFTPTPQLAVRIIADYNKINELCCGAVQLFNGPATQLIGAPRPIGLGGQVSDPAHKFDRQVAYNIDPFNKITGKGISGEIDYDFGGAKLTSITAYRIQSNRSGEDVDFTGADLSSRLDFTRTKTFTQEVRLASNGKGRFNWLLGAFYDHENLDTSSTLSFGQDIRAFADKLSGGNIFTLEYLQHFVTPSIIPGGTYFQPGVAIVAPFTLKQDSYSLFGQADYKVTDALTLTGGLAYLNDRKASTSNINLLDPFSRLNLQNVPQLPFLGIPASAFAALGGLQFFYANAPTHGPVNYPNANESGILKGHKLTYLARAAYDFGRINAYVSYSTGWKSGAYNLSYDARAPDVNGIGRTADPENTTLYEAGLKTRFRGGFVNLAVFKQSIKGFQSNAYTGTGYSLVNAGKESVKGFEVDAAARPLPWLSLTGGLTYLDAKYNSFLRAPCVSFDPVCPVNSAGQFITPFRDLSGQRPAGIPKWNASTSATISHDFGNGLSSFVRGEFDYSSKVQLVETVPANLSTYGNRNFNASIGIVSAPIGAQILFWARNLTNYKTIVAAFPTVAQQGSYTGYPNEPRTYGVTLTKRF
jgi:iron complex outermembrane receptor protein